MLKDRYNNNYLKNNFLFLKKKANITKLYKSNYIIKKS